MILLTLILQTLILQTLILLTLILQTLNPVVKVLRSVSGSGPALQLIEAETIVGNIIFNMFMKLLCSCSFLPTS